MVKGLDSSFLHYGVRKQDLAVITELCQKYELEEDWVTEELLKVYHELKVANLEVDDKSVEKLISKALQKIRQ